MARCASAPGAPRWRAPDGAAFAPRFAVLGMGKLGGEELNYSSDVDLIYVLEGSAGADSAARGPGACRRSILHPRGVEFGRW
jgi:glutamate-ammonia-ligase adenylyltransferase